MDQRTSYLSSTRGMRTDKKPPAVKSVSRPAKPKMGTSGGASDQAQALSQGFQGAGPAPRQEQDAYTTLPTNAQDQLRAGYQRGGFEGVVNSVGSDWYDIPEWQRTQILSGVRR
jgi:hypothetical protein